VNATCDLARSSGATAVEPEPGNVRWIPPYAAVVQVEGGYAMLVEACRPDAHGGASIEGAVALTVDAPGAAPRGPAVDEVPANSLLIFYCPSFDEDIVIRAVRELIRRGRDPADVAILDGDPEDWSDAGFSVLRR
jgi:hypothetical protein